MIISQDPHLKKLKLALLVLTICILGKVWSNLIQEIQILKPFPEENVYVKGNNLAPRIQQSSFSEAHTFINETISGVCKPVLIEHIGPLKTGTTQLQIEIVYSKKWVKTLWSDRLEALRTVNYREFNKFVTKCTSVTHQSRRDCTIWKKVEASYKKASLKAQESNCQVRMVHSLETLSNQKFIKSNYGMIKSLLRSLWKEWDTTVVLFYRRFDEWLISFYAQMRKYGFMNVIGFYEHYYVREQNHMTFPVFATKFIEDTPVVADILGIHGVYNDILSSKNNDTAEGDEVSRGGRIGTIQVLQFHSIHGVEQEFLCNLPNATVSCERIQNKNRNGQSKARNTSEKLPLDLDFVVVQAWNDGLVGIDRRQAQKLLETKMVTANITFDDLPEDCISKDHENWIWERALTSEKMFGNPPLPEIEFRQSFDVTRKKFCSVNAVAALKNKMFRSLFDDCGFFGNNTKLGTNWMNYLKLKELGCA